MEEDEFGFVYPNIDSSKCVNCGQCQRMCAYATQAKKNSPYEAYAAINIDQKQRIRSSSGGVFSAIAKKWIGDGGYICGAILEFDSEGVPSIHHIIGNKIEDIDRISGSKYVQSDITGIYVELRTLLERGEKILFTGTPCQVGQIKKMFGKYKEQLLTIDLICHGVPSQKMFRDAVAYWNRLHHGKIHEFDFRDKSIEWGLYARLSYSTYYGKEKSYILRIFSLAYYYFFIEAATYRESCYYCPYACVERAGDLTVGDFWRIENSLQEFAKETDASHKGVSCLLVNTVAGKTLVDGMSEYMKLADAEFSFIKKENGQLRAPSRCELDRERIMNEYAESGYGALVKELKHHLGIKFYFEQIKAAIPRDVKNRCRKIFRRG